MKLFIVAFIAMSLSSFQVVISSSYDSDTPMSSSSVTPTLDSALNAFYNADWDSAQSYLDLLKEETPDDPSVFFFDSMIPFWKYFFGGNRSEDAREFLDRSEIAINLGEKRLRASSRDTSTVLLLSGLHGYRSLVAASEREYRVAIRSGMTGFQYTRQLLSLDSDDPNAKMGRGVFNYMMGSIPSEIRWATSFAGISGDRETGIQELEEAATADSYVKIDALMILTYFYLRDEEFDNALRTSSQLVELYPDNSIFQFYHAKALESTNQRDDAIRVFSLVIENNQAGLEHLVQDSIKYVSKLKAD